MSRASFERQVYSMSSFTELVDPDDGGEEDDAVPGLQGDDSDDDRGDGGDDDDDESSSSTSDSSDDSSADGKDVADNLELVPVGPAAGCGARGESVDPVVARLQREYMAATLQVYTYYSVKLRAPQADGDDTIFFQVLSKEVKDINVKLYDTAAPGHARGLYVIGVQPVRQRRDVLEISDALCHQVFPIEASFDLDVLSLIGCGPDDDSRLAITEWTAGPSDYRACVGLHACSQLRYKGQLSDAQVPTLTLVDALRAKRVDLVKCK